MSEAKDENSSSKTLSAAARRSFFRRKHKHKRSGSKDGKDLLALDTISTDSIPFLDGKYLCYTWEGVAFPSISFLNSCSVTQEIMLLSGWSEYKW